MTEKKLKIAIVVHGRFHAFDLARELLKQDHDVTLFTNYPKAVCSRFGIPSQKVHSFLLHGVLTRIFEVIQKKLGWKPPESLLCAYFSAWAAKQLIRERWDVVQCWSGVGLEVFQAMKDQGALCVCERGSTHIRFQSNLLTQEQERTGAQIECPRPWIIKRELKEYALADMVNVPSTFSKKSFISEGFPESKLSVTLLGVDTRKFCASAEDMERRSQRILSGAPLRILNVGTFSFRKGAWDMASILRRFNPKELCFRFVGPVAEEARRLAAELGAISEFTPKLPQEKLRAQYTWGDLFILPTIEDGYPMVLAQASAAGLPILTTPNGAGQDLVKDGVTGWVFPARETEAFVEKLRWCTEHRKELAQMTRKISENFVPRDWSQVASDFARICQSYQTVRS